ncbi:MAG TPA: hypothetical protein VFB62_21255, partial [Polyangiaceae bacterium]|nr:hypothetical protein [Polyangiaceae bacterium]
LGARASGVIDERERQLMNACYSMAIGMSMVDSVVGADFHARHLLRALNAGDPARLARALALEAAHVASMGIENHARAISLVERAESLGRELGDSHALGLALMVRSADALFGADWQRAVAFGDEAVTLLRERCTNVAWEIATARRFTFAGLYYLGEIAELGRRMPEAVADARARGDLFAESCVRSGSSIVVWLARDDTATARRQLEDEARRWGDERFALQHLLALQGLTYVDLYEGRAGDAVARLARNWRRMERSQLLRMQLLRVTMVSLRARALLAAGDIVAAERDVVDLERESMPSAHGVAALLRAAIARHRGDARAAASGYRASIEVLDRLEMKLLAAAARRRLSELTGEDHSDAYFSAQGVHRPDALTAAVVP